MSATNIQQGEFLDFSHPLGNSTKICYNTFNAPVSVTDANGIVTKYAYNDAGLVTRMERLDGSETLTFRAFMCHADGQLASANCGSAGGTRSVATETFLWDGLALSTTVGSKSNGKYSAAALTAFGENYLTTQPPNHQTFFTGKPYVEGLGHAFLMRNYRAGLAKWQGADPMGYPDGWNQMKYGVNNPLSGVDLLG